MDSNNTISLISIAIQCGIPALLIGDPGEGKTAVFSGVASALNLPFESISAALFGPEDAFIPMPGEGKRYRTAHPDWAVNASESPHLILIDELTRASSRAGFNALLRVLQERRLGSLEFHKDTQFVATANPDTTDSGCMPIPAALANRIAWFTGEIDRDDWVSWMLTGKGGESKVIRLPGNWSDYIGDARAKVTAFLNSQPNLLKDIPKDGATPGPYPTRRSWTNAATLYGAALSMRNETIGYNLLRATIGAGTTVAFIEWNNKADLPDPSTVLDNIDTFTFPQRYDIRWAISTAAVSEAARRNTGDGWAKLEKLIIKLGAIGAKDIGAYTLSMVFSHKTKWMADNLWRPSQAMARDYLDIISVSEILR